MNTKTAVALFLLGMLLTLGGVGGVEHSLATVDLLSSLAVSVVGLLLMWVSTLSMNVSNYYD